ncbi:MAG: serine/threonine protein kinase [Psychromonas sp.]|jgi:serine/threonine protein kinase|uniref:bifunctional serine/threonine-protein kinase/formylglycine-generating enzyme family protein n=1 Tax=Psychromonas sp. TaxID=1884585 RepID=UPI0039E2E2A6
MATDDQQQNGSSLDEQQAKTVLRKSKAVKDQVTENAADEKTVFSPKPVADNRTASSIEGDLEQAVSDKTVIATSVAQKIVTLGEQHQDPQPLAIDYDDATRISFDNKPLAANIVQHGGSDITIQTKIGDPAKRETATPKSSIRLLKGRFELQDILGVGGMGIVYKAKDLLKVEAQDRDPYVAIKVLSEEFKTHPEAFISLQRESKKAQHIANQNTVKVYDFDRDGDVVFMTMEYMVGQPMDQMIKQYHSTGLPRNEAWNLLHGMCLALIHAHSENIVHSDLKPGNVFVTDGGIAKIFDFGIARAVASIDRSHNEQDRTVFDAGNLGALTPAYASREMLLGETPDVRDDIYALGCIAYEMLTGDHPFTRLPADEAYNKKLKPKRIHGIKKRHWKAIEAALAFERKDRIDSVASFYKKITEKKKFNTTLWFGVFFTLASSGYAYTEINKKEQPKISQAELMNQLEFKVRYQLLQENITRFLASPSFSKEWQSSLWEEVKNVEKLFPEKPTPWYFTTKETIYQLYLEQIKSAITAFNFSSAKNLINNAGRYSIDQTLLEQQKNRLAQQISLKEKSAKLNAQAARELAEANKLAAIAKQNKAAQSAKAKVITAANNKQNANLFDLAMDNVNKQLTCTQRLNMRDFKIAIEKLRSLDSSRFNKSEEQITKKLASCIVVMGQVSPDYAREAKRYALLLFNNNAAIASLTIKEKDDCQLSIAGLGSRGSRAVCKDTLKVGGSGPTLVVIPGSNKIKPFAFGKYEVSVGEYNLYCNKSNACEPFLDVESHLPVTGVSISDITGYIKWLSTTTGKHYRLPNKSEWLYAAQSSGNRLDQNRNCQISSRGISKGKELIKTTIGKQNSWGVVNYAGNAQELVYLSGRKLAAVGGSYKTSMDVCTSAALTNHSGDADQHTGFRLVRNIDGS